jgi:hypothetical protein
MSDSFFAESPKIEYPTGHTHGMFARIVAASPKRLKPGDTHEYVQWQLDLVEVFYHIPTGRMYIELSTKDSSTSILPVTFAERRDNILMFNRLYENGHPLYCPTCGRRGGHSSNSSNIIHGVKSCEDCIVRNRAETNHLIICAMLAAEIYGRDVASIICWALLHCG